MTYTRDALLIDGEWVAPVSDEATSVISPATEESIGRAPNASTPDVDRAVRAARASFDSEVWRSRSVGARSELIERTFELLAPRYPEIADLVTAEMGAPLTVSNMLVPDVSRVARYYCDVARSIPTVELRTGAVTAAVIREPVGVVAAIAPWNGPFNLAVNKIVPALLAGCSVVFKPAPETPFDAYFLAEALLEADLPPGVFNLVTGDRQTGADMVAHPSVDKVSFTGSTAAGRQIGETCGREFKRMQLELGGKSAAIILEDADVPTLLAGLGMGSFFNTGQACSAYSRVLAPRSRYDELVSAIAGLAESFVVGDPLDEKTTMGPVVAQRQRDRIEAYIASGIEDGARVVIGGGRPAGLARGWYVEPTVFADATNTMRIAREEIFGPVVTIIPYGTLDEAISIANDSEYGLHGGVFTAADFEAAFRVARAVRTGTFSVNAFVYNLEAPFGGMKSSGVGRDTGREAVTAYHELKTVNLAPGMENLVA